ncbi:hypothetical protein ABT351_31780, partial [Micromonospora sp. NPDC000018]
MSDDEETVVRERLRRLVGRPASAGPWVGFPDHPGRSTPPPVPLPSGADPASPPWPGSGPDPTAPSARSASSLAPAVVPVGRTASAEPGPPPEVDGGADHHVVAVEAAHRAALVPVADAGAGPADDGASPGQATPSRLPGPGAFDPGRRGVRALAVVAVLVVLGAGFWAWRSRPQAEPVRPAATTAG